MENEEVRYSFTGDTSSLESATRDAIASLTKFDSAMKKIASTDSFSASKTSVASFQRSLNGVIKQVNSLVTTMNKTKDVTKNMLPADVTTVESAYQNISATLELMGEQTSVTSKDLNFFAEALRETANSLNPVVARMQVWGTNLQQIQSLNQQVQASTEQTTTAVTQSVDTATTTVTQNVQYVESAMGDVTQSTAYLGSQMATMSQRVTAALNTAKATVQSYKDSAVAAFTSVKERCSQVYDAFRRVVTESAAFKTASKAITTLKDACTKVKFAVTKLASPIKNLGNKMKEAASKSTLLKKALALLGTVKLADLFSKAIKQSIAYIENLNLFKVAMGEAYESGRKFIDQMQEVYGMDPSTLMRYAGNFYQLATAIEMPDEAAEKMSLSLTKATNDIASLFNMPIEQVFENLSSGMQGMSRAVRKYGMDIRVTTLQQTALSLGITEQVETMSEANRMGLRFITMMRQASNAQGDFARNIETPANQLRIFKEQLAQLGRAIGNFVLVPLGKLLQYVNGAIMALRVLLQFLAKVFGVQETTFQIDIGTDAAEDAENTADAVGDIGDEASKTAKKMKQMLAPFDELNILQKPTDNNGASSSGLNGVGGAMDPAIAQEIADMDLSLENIQMKANQVRDTILEFLGFQVEGGEIISWDPAVLQGMSEDFTNLAEQIQFAFDSTREVVTQLWEGTLQPVLSSLWGAAQRVFVDIMNILLTLYNRVLIPILQWIASTAGPTFARIFGGFMDTVVLVYDTIKRAVDSFASTFESIWNGWLRPILDVILEVVESIWTETVKPVIDNIIGLVGDLWDFLMVVIKWIADALGPWLVPIIQALIPVVSTVINTIGGIINGIITVLRGVIQFMTNVFKGNWQGVWESLGTIVTGVAQVIVSVFKGAINLLVDAINALVAFVWPVIRDIGNAIGGLVTAAGKIFGKSWGWTMPSTPPRIPHLAEGGIVTRPTVALLGEAGRSEAVIPLDNSPQIVDLAQQIADKINLQDTPVVNVYIGGEEFDDYIYEALSRREFQTNGGV